MLDRRRRILSQSRDERDELFAKRPRTTNLFHDYLRHTAEPRSNAKRAALHVLAFIFQEGPVEVGDLILTLEKLTGYISDENPVHSSWAMIALTACV
jgi:ataxia telangiectasia mutated family protein